VDHRCLRKQKKSEDSDDDLCLIEDDDDIKNTSDASKETQNGNKNTANNSSAGKTIINLVDDDDICFIEDNDILEKDANEAGPSVDKKVSPKKRKVNEDHGEPSSKRSKIDIADDEVVLIDDD